MQLSERLEFFWEVPILPNRKIEQWFCAKVMPIYEYECQACGAHHEIMHSIKDAPVKKCPRCGKPKLQKMVSASGFVLKGTGWYVTDFRDKKAANNGADDKTAEKSGGKADDKKDDTKAETPASGKDAPKDDGKAAAKSADAETTKKTEHKPEQKSENKTATADKKTTTYTRLLPVISRLTRKPAAQKKPKVSAKKSYRKK